MKNLIKIVLISIFCHNALAQENDRPNFLFIIADDIGSEMIGAYGNEVIETPNIDQLAQEGIMFENAYTTNAKCAPSRASILSGRHFFQLETGAVHSDNFPVKFKSYQLELEQAGYFVGYTGKGWGPGSWKKSGWKQPPTGKSYNSEMFAKGLNARVGFRNAKVSEEEKQAAKLRASGKYDEEAMRELIFSGNVWNTDYTANFELFLKNRPAEKSFSFWYGSHDGHRPWLAGAGRRHIGDSEKVKVYPFYPDVAEMHDRLLDIGVEVELFDNSVGEAIALLKEYGLYENTVIIVTSDNGTDGNRSKGDIYPYASRLPLVIISPWLDQAVISKANVSFRDFAPTILELANVAIPETVTGKSFAKTLTKGKSKGRNYILGGRENYSHRFIYPVRTIIKDDYCYVRNYWYNKRYPEGTLDAPVAGHITTAEVPYEASLLEAVLREKENGNLTYWNWVYEKRDYEELYNIVEDPYCLNNLAPISDYKKQKDQMSKLMNKALEKESDPRAINDKDMIEFWEN